jgi:hypothetical protein
MNKEVILIGGKFHRKRVMIDANSHSHIMAIPPQLDTYVKIANLMAIPVEVETVTYKEVGSIFGEYGVIPSNVFLEENIDPLLFLRNLVLDYVK